MTAPPAGPLSDLDEALLPALLLRMADAVVVVDAQRQICRVNPAFSSASARPAQPGALSLMPRLTGSGGRWRTAPSGPWRRTRPRC